MQLKENVTLGLDVGIGSIGWALVETLDDGTSRVVTKTGKDGAPMYAIGSRVVNVPEHPKTHELLNVKRRQARQMRRVIKRRANRMRAIRRLLVSHGIEDVKNIEAFHHPKGQGTQLDPGRLRVEALERRLTDNELAVILLNIAKHRGFRSNSKRDKTGDKTVGVMLKAVSGLEAVLAEPDAPPTLGVYLAGQPRRRNRAGYDGKPCYEHTVPRRLHEEEIDRIFEAQQSFDHPKATEALRQAYKDIAFEQRPLKSTANLVGKCVFLEEEKRAPRFAPTSERFRLAQRLVNLRLSQADGQSRPLTSDETQLILARLGEQKSITFKTARKLLKLPETTRFEGLSYGKLKNGKPIDPETADIAVSGSGGCGPGSHIFRAVLGPTHYATLSGMAGELGGNCLDHVAKVISDNDDIKTIADELSALPLSQEVCADLVQAVRDGAFATFRGTLNLSLKAMDVILPRMIEAGDYAMGCELAGFDHAKARAVDLNDVRNPVVRRILREVRRQAEAIFREFGVIPGRVHVELLRDVGKSQDERLAIKAGIDKRTKEKNRLREELAEAFGIAADQVSGTELLRYELWRAQQHKCAYYTLFSRHGGERVYTGPHKEGAIGIMDLRDTANTTQIDHILPRSRTFDNSFHNLCLCCSGANQAKGNRTPYEWIGASNATAWHAFEQWVGTSSFKGLKRRNFLLKNLDSETEDRFSNRSLNDSSYIARLVQRWFGDYYERNDIPMEREDGTGIRRVFARPGALTAFLRREWGVESLKKDASGKRFGDRHHALDALIVACCSEGLLQRLTRLFKRAEAHQPHEQLATPWPDFRPSAERLLSQIFVSRAEQGRTKGALHEETLRSFRIEPDAKGNPREMVYERKPIGSLTMKDLERIKDPKRCPDVIEALRTWIEANKPKDEDKLPRSIKGDIIRSVKLLRGPFTSGVRIARGEGTAQADNGEMVRTEVYEKQDKYYLVPVYTWQEAQCIRPNRAIIAYKPESEWLIVDETFTFVFSLTSNSYIVTENKKGEVREGYFLGTNRSVASINLAAPFDKELVTAGIGVQRLTVFNKYRVDRLGRLSLVRKEKRP